MKKLIYLSAFVVLGAWGLVSCNENCTTCTKVGEDSTHKLCGNRYEICFTGGPCVDTTADEAFIQATQQGLELMGFTCQ